jgi:hypothetical protein
MNNKGKPKAPKKLHPDRQHRGFDPERAYRDHFLGRPGGPPDDHGQAEGFDTWLWINDPSLFNTPSDPVKAAALEAFLDRDNPDRVMYYFAQFKSSHVSSELFIHSPRDAMTGNVPEVNVDAFDRSERAVERVQTLIMNHDATLAHHSIKTMAAVDRKGDAGLLVYKEEKDSSS